MSWYAEERGGFWYTIKDGVGRIPTLILRRSQEHAEETAQALNRVDIYYDH